MRPNLFQVTTSPLPFKKVSVNSGYFALEAATPDTIMGVMMSVKNIEQFKILLEKLGDRLGCSVFCPESNDYIVTARIKRKSLEIYDKDDNVINIEPPQAVYPVSATP